MYKSCLIPLMEVLLWFHIGAVMSQSCIRYSDTPDFQIWDLLFSTDRRIDTKLSKLFLILLNINKLLSACSSGSGRPNRRDCGHFLLAPAGLARSETSSHILMSLNALAPDLDLKLCFVGDISTLLVYFWIKPFCIRTKKTFSSARDYWTASERLPELKTVQDLDSLARL